MSILYARISRKDSNISKNIGVPAKGSKERAPRDTTIVQGDYKLIKDIDTGRLFLFNLKRSLARPHGDMQPYHSEFPGCVGFIGHVRSD